MSAYEYLFNIPQIEKVLNGLFLSTFFVDSLMGTVMIISIIVVGVVVLIYLAYITIKSHRAKKLSLIASTNSQSSKDMNPATTQFSKPSSQVVINDEKVMSLYYDQSALCADLQRKNDFYQTQLREMENKLHLLQIEQEQLNQKHMMVINRINKSPPEVQNFLLDRNNETYDSSKIQEQAMFLKKEWDKLKSSYAVWPFKPVFTTLDKISKGQDAYNYAGRPYYSVDQIVDLFEEMLLNVKHQRYLWDALEWLKKNYG